VYGADNPEIAEKYRVKGMPSYVLIDPNGDISLLHAPTPEDNFQEKFAEIYLRWRKNESERIKQEQFQRQW
jgi:thioredoxin-related protein